MLDLDSGIFTCITPGYYTVSFSAYGAVGPDNINPSLYLYKNGIKLPESVWWIVQSGALNAAVGVISSRILVSLNLLDTFHQSPSLQILHMDLGDTLELRLQPFGRDAVDALEQSMANSLNIHEITFNIELTGFDYLV